MSSSLTSTKSSRSSQRIRCGSSNAVRVASPSANVFIWSSSRRARLPGACGGRSSVGLHADHFDVCAASINRDAHAGRAAAAADRHDDRRDVVQLLQDLERRSRDARDQQRLVARVHVTKPALDCESLAVLARLVEVASVERRSRLRARASPPPSPGWPPPACRSSPGHRRAVRRRRSTARGCRSTR